MEIGISTGFFHKQSIFDSLSQIRDSGIKYLELWTFSKMLDSTIHFNPADRSQIDKLKEMLDEYALETISIHAPFSADLDISSPDEKIRRKAVNYAIMSAEALDIISGNGNGHKRTVVIHPSSMPFKDRQQEMKIKFEHAKKCIGEIYGNIRQYKIKLALENQLPHIFGSEAVTLFELLDGISPDECGICFDTSHASMHTGTTVEQFLKGFYGRILTLHVSDSDLKTDRHLPFSYGKINWQEALSGLKTSGYSGIFMNEILEEIPGKNKLETMKMLKDSEIKLL